MQFSYVTLFEGLIASYFEDSILKRAIAKGLLEITFLNLEEAVCHFFAVASSTSITIRSIILNLISFQIYKK